jgi:hypothetical protein
MGNERVNYPQMNFANEKMLVDRLLSLLQSQSTFCGPVHVTPEFFYSRGRTDVVAVAQDESLIAFEAKLTDWRTGLHQAYRNTCFAHSSYVVLPKRTALAAFRFAGEFEKRGVGLCYVDDSALVVLRMSSHNKPLEPWLAYDAVSLALGSVSQ